MLVYKQWDVTFNIIYDFSTINKFVLTVSNEIFLYFHVSTKKRLQISGLPFLTFKNRASYI
jgi:flagellar assembly factor FliW